MAKAVYLVHYKQSRKHVRHAVRSIEAAATDIRSLYRKLREQAIDPWAELAGSGSCSCARGMGGTRSSRIG